MSNRTQKRGGALRAGLKRLARRARSAGTRPDAALFGGVEPLEGRMLLSTTVTVGNGAGDVKLVSYTDPDGTAVTVKLSAGSATLTFDRDVTIVNGKVTVGAPILSSVSLANTTIKSALLFTAKGGNGFASVGAITGSTALASITGLTLDLTGAGIDLTGTATLAALKLHDISGGADVSVAGNGLVAGTAITAAHIGANSDLTITTGVKSLKLNAWDAGGQLTAPWVASIKTAANKDKSLLGNFRADLALDGTGAPKGVTLGSVAIAGGAGSTDVAHPAVWNILGLVGSITVKGATDKFELTTSSTIKTLKFGRVVDANLNLLGDTGAIAATEWLAGTLSAHSAKSLAITGDKKAAVAGDFLVGVQFAGPVDPNIAQTLGSAKIAGRLGAVAWDVTGKVGSITAGAANGWSLTSASSLASLTLGRVANASVTLTGDAGAIKAVEWLAGSISAASVKLLTVSGDKKTQVAGNLGASLTLAGSADPNVKFTLGPAKVAGAVSGGTWTATAGALGPIAADSIAAGWALAAGASAITSITTTHDAGGTITATRIGVLNVKGALSGATISLSQAVDPALSALAKLTVAGQMLNSTIDAAGNIGPVTLGAMRTSTLFAGVSSAGLPVTANDFDALATIKAITIKGIKNDQAAAFSASNLAAATVGPVNLGTVAATSTGTRFGVATLAANFKPVTFNKSGVHTLSTAAEANAFAFDDDFIVRAI
jgi:hypothetical protein